MTLTRKPYVGTTQDTQDNSAMLGADFWKEGMEVTCLYNRDFATRYGQGIEFLLLVPRELWVKTDKYGHSSPSISGDAEARSVTRFAMPPLKGFDMAYQSLIAHGFSGFQHGDRCIVRCVGVQKSDDPNLSDMPKFEISVDPR